MKFSDVGATKRGTWVIIAHAGRTVVHVAASPGYLHQPLQHFADGDAVFVVPARLRRAHRVHARVPRMRRVGRTGARDIPAGKFGRAGEGPGKRSVDGRPTYRPG
jgi:hypothetical protein